MNTPAHQIVTALAQHIRIPCKLTLFGGGAMDLAYDRNRYTEDLDILVRPATLEAYAAEGLGESVNACNADLKAAGLYISHFWAPDQEVLVSGWETDLRTIRPFWDNALLQLHALNPLAMIASKLARFDDQDQGDIRHLIQGGWIKPEELRALPATLLIPRAWEIEAPHVRRRAEQIAHDGAC